MTSSNASRKLRYDAEAIRDKCRIAQAVRTISNGVQYFVDCEMDTHHEKWVPIRPQK